MAPFIMKKGGGMGVQRRQEREGGRERERETDSTVQRHTGLSPFHFWAEVEQLQMKKSSN